MSRVWSGAAGKTKIQMDANGLLGILRLSVGVRPRAGMPRALFVVTKVGLTGCSPWGEPRLHLFGQGRVLVPTGELQV